EVARVECVVTVEFPSRSMQRAGTRLEDHSHGAGGGKTVVRAIVRSESAEFGNGVRRRSDAHATCTAAVIVFAAVQQVNVVVLAQAVEFDARVAANRSIDVVVNLAGCARRQCRELINAAAIDGQLIELLTGDDVRKLTRVGLDTDGVRFHRYSFLRATD